MFCQGQPEGDMPLDGVIRGLAPDVRIVCRVYGILRL